jgi:soluble cytochrome b562
MAIIDDHGAIAKRLRELKCVAPKNANEITELEKWKSAALDAARAYVQKRKQEIARKTLFRRAPESTHQP